MLCFGHYVGHFEMAYHEREYEVYILKGMEDSVDLWSWQHWEPWAIALAPFTTSPRGKATVRCLQYSADPKKMVPFGRLSWDEKSHHRWTHNSPTNGEEWKRWGFLSMEAWAPSWTICEREIVPPDFYLSMHNPNCHRSAPRRPSPFLVCAVPYSLGQSRVMELESVLISLSKSLHVSVLAHKRRPWGIGSLRQDSFTYAIQDMTEFVLSGATDFDRMRKPFNEDLLPETWRRIESRRA